MSSPALTSLLEQLCCGDANAAEQVFLAYEPYLREVVRRKLPARLRAKFDSGDIVQSTWRHLLDGFRTAGWRFASPAQLQAFLVRATRNQLIDHCRKEATALDREQSLAEVGHVDLPPARGATPSEVAQAGDLWEQLLALCPPEHQELLHLRRQGVPLDEVAARTGLHVGSVRRILRGLAVRLAGAEQPPALAPRR
jgi:RNA polymerase sigma factor (sigma-70 family)